MVKKSIVHNADSCKAFFRQGREQQRAAHRLPAQPQCHGCGRGGNRQEGVARQEHPQMP